MKASRIIISVLVLLGIGAVAYTLKNREKTFGSEAQAEAQTQAAEIQQCKAQLAIIHKAWSDYRKDHKGGEPQSADLMKYIKDPKVLICPTEVRWEKLGKPMRSGSFRRIARNISRRTDSSGTPRSRTAYSKNMATRLCWRSVPPMRKRSTVLVISMESPDAYAEEIGPS